MEQRDHRTSGGQRSARPPQQQQLSATPAAPTRRLTSEQISSYLAERGAAASARLKQWEAQGIAGRMLPNTIAGAQVPKGGERAAQEGAAAPAHSAAMEADAAAPDLAAWLCVSFLCRMTSVAIVLLFVVILDGETTMTTLLPFS